MEVTQVRLAGVPRSLIDAVSPKVYQPGVYGGGPLDCSISRVSFPEDEHGAEIMIAWDRVRYRSLTLRCGESVPLERAR
jgi:hypothetical protein